MIKIKGGEIMPRFEPVSVMIKKIPIPIFAVALAQCALGNLIVLHGGPKILYWLCGVMGLVSMFLFVIKFMSYPKLIKDDITSSPVLAGVSGSTFMAFMQLATYLRNFNYDAALVLWFAAIVGHVALIIWFTWRFVFLQHAAEQFYPTYFLVYAGIAVASLTSPQFHMETLGWVIFWGSFIFFVLSFLVVVWRYLTRGAIPLGFKPFFCLFTAPPSLFLASWAALYPDKIGGMTFLLLGIAQMFFLMVLIYLPKLFQIKFFPSYAALGFPFVITAFAIQLVLSKSDMLGIDYPTWLLYLSYGEFAFCSVAVIYVTIWYISYIINYCIICHGNQTL